MKNSWRRKRRDKSWRLKRLQLPWNPKESRTAYQVAVAKTQTKAGWKGATPQLPSFCSMQKRVTNKPQNALTQVKLLPFKSFHVIFHLLLPSGHIFFVVISHTNVTFWKHKNAGIGYISWISSWKCRVCLYFMLTVYFLHQNVVWLIFANILCPQFYFLQQNVLWLLFPNILCPQFYFLEQNAVWFTFPIILCLSLDSKLWCISPAIVLESDVGYYLNITVGYVMFHFCWM